MKIDYLLSFIMFILGMSVSFFVLSYVSGLYIVSSNKVIMSHERFAEECRNICYFNVYGEPYPGSCEE